MKRQNIYSGGCRTNKTEQMFPVNNIAIYNIIIEPTMTNISRSMVVIKKKAKASELREKEGETRPNKQDPCILIFAFKRSLIG